MVRHGNESRSRSCSRSRSRSKFITIAYVVSIELNKNIVGIIGEINWEIKGNSIQTYRLIR